MKDAILAYEPEEGAILVRKGNTYTCLKEESRFRNAARQEPDYEGNIILVEKILDDKTYSFSLKASPSLSADPVVYLKALGNVFDNKHIELSNPKENMDLGASFEIPIKTGVVGFSGKYKNQDAKGTIGADVNTLRDLVRIDIEYADKNKELLSSIRKALLGINPEIDGSSDITYIVDVSGRKERQRDLYIKRKVAIV